MLSIIIFVAYLEKLLLAVLTESELVILNLNTGKIDVYDGKIMYR